MSSDDLTLNTWHQDSSLSNSRQGDMPYRLDHTATSIPL